MFKGKKVSKETLGGIKGSSLRDKLAESDRAALAMVYLNTNRFVTLRRYKDHTTVNVPTIGIFSYNVSDDAVADQHAMDKILSAAKEWALAQINK